VRSERRETVGFALHVAFGRAEERYREAMVRVALQ
jgi:hypothetical protein